MTRVTAKADCAAFLSQKREACEKRSKLFEDEMVRIMRIVDGNRGGLSDEDLAVSEEEWLNRCRTVLTSSPPLSRSATTEEDSFRSL